MFKKCLHKTFYYKVLTVVCCCEILLRVNLSCHRRQSPTSRVVLFFRSLFLSLTFLIVLLYSDDEQPTLNMKEVSYEDIYSAYSKLPECTPEILADQLSIVKTVEFHILNVNQVLPIFTRACMFLKSNDIFYSYRTLLLAESKNKLFLNRVKLVVNFTIIYLLLNMLDKSTKEPFFWKM